MSGPHHLLTGILIMLLLSACTGADPTPAPTIVPTVTASPVATATTFVMPTVRPSATPIPVTPTATAIQLDPLAGVAIEPPLTLDLPPEWLAGYDMMVFNDVGELTDVPFGLYTGPVSGGTATIVILWNFRSISPGNPLAQPSGGQPDLWLDGLRLLRSLIIEPACNIGTDQRYEYRVGGLPAVGTQWSAIDCPDDLPDTRGWFAGLNVENVNFLFYVYSDPITALDGPAIQEVQAILDSVQFTLNTGTPASD